MGQTWSMAEAVTRGQGIYDFVWPPEEPGTLWPYVGGWGDFSPADAGLYFSKYPSVPSRQEPFPSVSGISIGPTSTVPSVAVIWQENASALTAAPKEIRSVVSLNHPIDCDVPGGFRLEADQGDSLTLGWNGYKDIYSTGYNYHLRPLPVFRYKELYYPANGTALQPFGSALMAPCSDPVPRLHGVFIPPRLHLRLHLDGSRPVQIPRHPYAWHLVHVPNLPATDEVFGVFPIAGRSRVAVTVSFTGANPVGETANFRISGILPHVRLNDLGDDTNWAREVLLWPTTPGGTIGLVGNVNSVARAVFQEPECDFLMITGQTNLGTGLLIDVAAKD